jgi:hypothetical protein
MPMAGSVAGIVAEPAYADTVASGRAMFTGDAGDYISGGQSYSYDASNGQPPGRRGTDTAGRAGDDRDPAVERARRNGNNHECTPQIWITMTRLAPCHHQTPIRGPLGRPIWPAAA